MKLRIGLLAVALIAASCSRAADRTSGADPPRKEEQAADAAEYETARARMLRMQLMGPGRDIQDPRVLEAMRTVPRHAFVPPSMRRMAYADRALPIGHGQTISQPYIVAFMTEHVKPRVTDRVLEIGTGSGYQAAVLAKLVREVFTIEIVTPLADRAAKTLRRLGYDNVHVRAGDGYQGWPEHAPFDVVIVTCAPTHIPEPLVAQLREGGRMIIPVGARGGAQELVLLEKIAGKIEQRAVLPVRFVPMTGESEERSASRR